MINNAFVKMYSVTVKNEDLSRKTNLKTRNQKSFEQCINIRRHFVSRDIGSKILNERNSKQILGDRSKVYASSAFKTSCCDC